MYKSKFFTTIAILTFITLSVIIYFQFEEMKTYGLLNFMLEANP